VAIENKKKLISIVDNLCWPCRIEDLRYEKKKPIKKGEVKPTGKAFVRYVNFLHIAILSHIEHTPLQKIDIPTLGYIQLKGM